MIATQRLMLCDSDSKEFDFYLKYCASPLGADFYKGDKVGEYGGLLTGDHVAVVLNDGKKAYTKGENLC